MATAALEADRNAAAPGAMSPVLGEPELAQPASPGELVAWAKLDRMQGPGERRAVLLALLLTPDSAREQQAWSEECRDVMQAAVALDLVGQLGAAARPSAFECVLHDSQRAPQGERVELLRSARRLMCADGRVGPLDRLRWIYLRQCLANGEPGIGNETLPTDTPGDLESRWVAERGGRAGAHALPETARLGTSRLTAYLARMVPRVDPQSKVGSLGVAWHRSVMRELWGDEGPACRPPDGDQLMHALAEVQALSWMQRPILARTWSAAAFALARRRPPALPQSLPQPGAATAHAGDDASIQPPAAPAPPVRTEVLRPDPVGLHALRVACRLIDAPLPPDLARCFVEHPQARSTA
jgi:hypothetical protein